MWWFMATREQGRISAPKAKERVMPEVAPVAAFWTMTDFERESNAHTGRVALSERNRLH